MLFELILQQNFFIFIPIAGTDGDLRLNHMNFCKKALELKVAVRK